MSLRKLRLLRVLLRELLPSRLFGRGTGLVDHLVLLRNLPVAALNIKNFGYELGHSLAATLAQLPIPESPGNVGIVSKPTTQSDIESPWFRYWCAQLKSAPIYHRKLWEFAFSLQALHEHGRLAPGMRGIGFGCGQEPLASYFAARGIDALVTDLEPERVAGLGWSETGQHASSIEKAFHPDIVSREAFERHVSHRYVDMNRLPHDEEPFDFCWSICALEHLGSIRQGLDFVENALALLKPGGIAVHTTEFNYLSDTHTIDDWMTVLFQRKHFIELAARLRQQGHEMLGPDFSIGDGVLDRFVDLPPFALDEGGMPSEQWSRVNQNAHLKLSIDGYPCTCYGIVVRKSTN